MNKNVRSEQGTALVATLMFLMAMGILSTALVFTVQNDMKTSVSYKYGQQSFFEANAAVMKGVNWFNTPVSSGGYTPHLTAAYDVTTCPVQFNESGWKAVLLSGKTPSNSVYPDGSVKTTFRTNFHNISLEAGTDGKNAGLYALDATLMRHRSVQFMDPATFTTYPGAVERWRLESVGYWGSKTKPLGIAQITAVIENNGEAFFDRALWGKILVDMRGASLIDSYNPDLGPWDGNLDGTGPNQGMNAAIGSNGRVEMGGNTHMFGDIGLGPTATYAPGGTLTGTPTRLATDRTFDPLPAFSAGQNATQDETIGIGEVFHMVSGHHTGDEYRNIRVQGDLYFDGGTYYIKDLTQTGQGRIFVTAETKLYIESTLTLTGLGIMNVGGDTNSLMILFAGTRATMEGGSSAAIEFYGPNADLTLRGGADFSGSFIANTVTVGGNSSVHYNNDSLAKHLIERPFRLITWSQDSY